MPERCLTGRTPAERAAAHEWLSWLSGTLHGQGYGALWRPERFSDDPAAHAGVRAKARLTILACHDAIESRLTSGPTGGPAVGPARACAVGAAFTVVDPFLFVFYRWGNGVGVDMAARYPAYTAYAQGLIGRASVGATLVAEGLDEHPLNDRRVPGTFPAA